MHKIFTTVVLMCCLMFFIKTPSHCQYSSATQRYDTLSTPTLRLIQLSKLWSTLKYFHPYLQQDNNQWASSLIAAVPSVTMPNGNYEKAITQLLTPLNDPVTCLRSPETDSGNFNVETTFLKDSILLITVKFSGSSINLDPYKLIANLSAAGRYINISKVIIFDLRNDSGIRPDFFSIDELFNAAALGKHFLQKTIYSPDFQFRSHEGLVAGHPASAGEFTSSTKVVSGKRFNAPTSLTRPRQIYFVINQFTVLPKFALAMQQAKLATFIGEGPVTEAVATDVMYFDMREKIDVQIRLSQMMLNGAPKHFAPDIFVSKGTDMLQFIKTFRRDQRTKSPALKKVPMKPVQIPAIPISTNDFPPLPQRVLAAAEIWGAVEYFFPYKDLMDEDWDAVFEKHFPAIVYSKSADEYHLAVAALYAQIDDGHGFVSSRVLDHYFGTASPPLKVSLVEGKIIVTTILDKALSDVQVGDEVVSVDGEATGKKLNYIRQYIAASTPGGLNTRSTAILLMGQPASKVQLTIRKADGQTKDIAMSREAGFYNEVINTSVRPEPVMKKIDAQIGYANLTKLSVDLVDSMFRYFHDTGAIIFDMRGYPQGTMMAIAPRLITKHQCGALVERTFLSAQSVGNNLAEITKSKSRTAYNITPDTRHYKGKVVVLIDENAISQAEHSCLLYKSSGNVTFIGTPTAGANGDITNFRIPGNITLYFSGLGILFNDGSPLQRKGVQPDVYVAPTVAGIRAGRDEQLEKAVEHLHKILPR